MPMTINELLAKSGSQFSTEIFDTKSIAAVEATLTEKNGKPFLKCRVRDKEVAAKPEEIIRQLWLHRLEHHYKYPVARIGVEYAITFGRDTSKRADIVVFDADRPTVPYLIVEVKQPTEKGGKDQLKSYTHATGAPLSLWSDGLRAVIWHRKNDTANWLIRAGSHGEYEMKKKYAHSRI
jgi:type I restriction enzyme M protein